MIKDLRLAKQNEMADFIQNNQDKALTPYIEKALEGKRYFVFCRTCGIIFVDLPFAEFYKKHTHPEWDLWFCDAVLHWADNPSHSIYCFSDTRKYNISSSLAVDCRNIPFKQVKIDVTNHRKTLANKKGKI